MDKQREKFVAEMDRIREAMKKTRSEYLRKDYQKHLSRMQKELRMYDSYKKNSAG